MQRRSGIASRDGRLPRITRINCSSYPGFIAGKRSMLQTIHTRTLCFSTSVFLRTGYLRLSPPQPIMPFRLAAKDSNLIPTIILFKPSHHRIAQLPTSHSKPISSPLNPLHHPPSHESLHPSPRAIQPQHQPYTSSTRAPSLPTMVPAVLWKS